MQMHARGLCPRGVLWASGDRQGARSCVCVRKCVLERKGTPGAPGHSRAQLLSRLFAGDLLHARRKGASSTTYSIQSSHALRRGTPALRDEDDVFSNHIHAEDLAAICVAALERDQA